MSSGPRVPKALAVACIVLVATGGELAVPVLWGTEDEGLMVTGQVFVHAGGKERPAPDPKEKTPKEKDPAPKPDPDPAPKPDPNPDPEPPAPPAPPRADPDGATVGRPEALWYVVRRTAPSVPVWGPYLWDEPECRGYERRFVTIYLCRRLP